MDILFGRVDKPGNGGGSEFKGPPLSTDTKTVGGVPGGTNQYDDDYASDYGDGQPEGPVTQAAYFSKPVAGINDTEDAGLLELLAAPYKSPGDLNSKQPELAPEGRVEPVYANKNNTETLDLLSALMDVSTSTMNDRALPPAPAQQIDAGQDDLKARAGMVLGKLKKLPVGYLEKKPGGVTKVIAKGLKTTRLTLKDCVSVLNAAGLLVWVDGMETGMDRSGEKLSQYFLVKADLLDGK